METLSAKLMLYNGQVLDHGARQLLMAAGEFQTLPMKRAEEVWGGAISGHILFMAQTQEAAVFISRDWEVIIRSRRLIDCVGALCTTLNTLTGQFNTLVGVELLDTHNRSNIPLPKQLDEERSKERYLSIARSTFLLVAGGLISYGITMIF